ncbi:Crp/Fnr family transcriptional regulator [Pseudaeromonas sp. ZJS20]|uniref:Crp/Fnr family transcriptional regulator n=1 Tax=Pseudaeromonas aegiceratis TaxID=3153928 RepID=UPI00390C544E
MPIAKPPAHPKDPLSAAPLAQADWPGDISTRVQQALLALARPVDLMQQHSRLSEIPGIFYLEQGAVLMAVPDGEMKSSIGMALGPGDWWGIHAFDPASPRLFALMELVAQPVVWLFPKAEVEQLASRQPEVYKWLFAIALRLHGLRMQLHLNSWHSLPQRVAYLLLHLGERCGQPQADGLQLPVSQQQLSQLAGISRPRLNEVLKQFEGQGLLQLGRGQIRLLDIPGLRAPLQSLNLMFHDPLQSPDSAAPQA